MPRTRRLAEFRLILLVVCAFGANSMIGAAQEKKGTEDELKGTWVVVATFDKDGKRLALETNKELERELPFLKFTFAAGKLTINPHIEEGKDGRDEGTYTLDPKKMAIDIVPTTSDDKGKKIQGIYELQKDSLKLSISRPGGERPTEFKSRPAIALELKREK